jgi:tetratricopeptide (TPR) repeat protein
MKEHTRLPRRTSLLVTLTFLLGCSELRARQHAREGNQHFREGDYAAAVEAYSKSEALHPLAVVAFNRGLACRQLMLPGAKTARNDRAVDCALSAFSRMKQLNPSDPRAERLYQQTLFDADRFDALARIYERALRDDPKDPIALNAMIQVQARWGRWSEALRYTIERAERRRDDAEAQYAVGVFIYNRLFEKGGGPDKSNFNPRSEGADGKQTPTFTTGDITGAERIRLAEQGLAYLQRALSIRPTYADALTYSGLLERQKSFALFDRPAEWQAAVESAQRYAARAAAAHVKHPPQH